MTNSLTSFSFHAIPRDFLGDFCSVFPLCAIVSESRADLHMLSQIGVDQRHERSSEKVSSARLIVYTAHSIRAGLDFQDRVPILSVLGLPLDMVRVRVKFWSGTDGAKSKNLRKTKYNLFVPSLILRQANVVFNITVLSSGTLS